MHLEGKLDLLFQGLKAGQPTISWEEFGEEIQRRFSEIGQPDVVEKMYKLHQTTSVLSYQERFEELMSGVTVKAPNM